MYKSRHKAPNFALIPQPPGVPGRRGGHFIDEESVEPSEVDTWPDTSDLDS